jgi:antitoxin component YwqK of YwqJK toxin-antitoxin module
VYSAAGQLNGPYRSWFDNAQRKSEGNYVLGKMEGPWKFWQPDGTPNEDLTGEYANDHRKKEQ